MRDETRAGSSMAAPLKGARTYGPLIKGGQVKRRYRLGPYQATLLGRVESSSLTDYLYVMAFHKEQAVEPCLLVTSEVNADCWNIGGGSHFLFVFHREVRSNMGASDDWANIDKFTSKALAIAAAELRVPDAPRELIPSAGNRGPRRTASGRLV